MVSDVAHELRTPLTNIRGYLEALQDGVVPPTQETFQLLQEETLRLISLVENLLQLARADAARLSLDLEETDIAELASRALKKFDLEFKQKDIQVRTELGEAGDSGPGRPRKTQPGDRKPSEERPAVYA